MAPGDSRPDPMDLWDIAVPPRPSGVPGATMAGFAHRASVGEFDLEPLPYPAVTLVIDVGGDSVVVDDAHGGQHRGSMVLPLAPGRVRAHGSGLRCLQVRLPPPVAQAVLGAPAASLGDAVVDLSDLWGDDAERLESALRATTSWNRRFALLDAELAARHETGATSATAACQPELAHAWHEIVGSRGRVQVEGLTATTGWSRKRLWSRFRAQIGMGPKRAAMLARFDHAAHRLAAGVAPAQVAAEAGYADQSHLHRDVRAFADTTPAGVATAPWLAVDPIAWPT